MNGPDAFLKCLLDPDSAEALHCARVVQDFLGEKDPYECALRLKESSFLLLDNPELQTLKPLFGLRKLKRLAVRSNSLQDISACETLSGLEELSIQAVFEGVLESIAPLRGLPLLKKLTITYNRIEDISPLSSVVSLSYLDLSHEPIRNFEPLRNLRNHETLILDGASLSSQLQLPPLLALTSLRFWGCNVKTLEGIEQWPNLRELNAGSNEIEDVRGIESAKRLVSVNLPMNKISDIAPLARLAEVYEIGLGGNPVITIAPLAYLPRLKTLRVSVATLGETEEQRLFRGVKIIRSES